MKKNIIKFLTFVILYSCQSQMKKPSFQTSHSEANSKPHVIVYGDLKTQTIQVELAKTQDETARGLMFRKNPLGESRGMLFIMPSKKVQSFWMKNTYIPLDIIFITYDENLGFHKVVGISKNAKPETLTSRSVGEPSEFVLEVDAGLSDQWGLFTGSKIEFNIPGI